jgi:hypothetical protein
VHTASAPRATPFEYSFAKRARIAVDHPAIAQRMPLTHLDRHGLAFQLRDPGELPALGLPRTALIVAGDEPLCTLRLVVRGLRRASDDTLELTMQPSRADDHESFWRALRVLQQRRRAAVVHSFFYRQPEQDPMADEIRLDRPLHPREQPGAALRRTQRPAPALHEPPGAGRSRTAAFMLARSDDALFFAEWLEYHFAEIGEQTHSGSRHAELKQLRPHIAGREVRVEFSYRYDLADATQGACTEEACRWIESEVKRRFDLRTEHYLPDAPGFAGIGSRRAAACYSFSSK